MWRKRGSYSDIDTDSGDGRRATPSPTAVPLPPLAILEQGPPGSVSAVDAAGRVQWTLASTALDRLLSGTATDGVSAQAAGPNVVLTRTIGPYGHKVGHLVVIGRDGDQVGSGTFTQSGPGFEADIVPVASPTGTEWAWRVQDGSTPNVHGRVLVAGVGEAPHSILSWVAPTGSFDETVAAWTDMGIVLERLTYSGCGAGFAPDSASFLVDPVTGTLTQLFSGEHYGDGRHGVRVALPTGSASEVSVNGVTFDEAGTVVTLAQVSPDGTTVGVRRYLPAASCGNPSQPSLSTELIDVAAGTHTDISGCGFNGWFNSTEFVCSPYTSATQTLDTVNGRTVATLGTGHFVGVIPGS